jgi:hypothetical protein
LDGGDLCSRVVLVGSEVVLGVTGLLDVNDSIGVVVIFFLIVGWSIAAVGTVVEGCKGGVIGWI